MFLRESIGLADLCTLHHLAAGAHGRPWSSGHTFTEAGPRPLHMASQVATSTGSQRVTKMECVCQGYHVHTKIIITTHRASSQWASSPFEEKSFLPKKNGDNFWYKDFGGKWFRQEWFRSQAFLAGVNLPKPFWNFGLRPLHLNPLLLNPGRSPRLLKFCVLDFLIKNNKGNEGNGGGVSNYYQ